MWELKTCEKNKTVSKNKNVLKIKNVLKKNLWDLKNVKNLLKNITWKKFLEKVKYRVKSGISKSVKLNYPLTKIIATPWAPLPPTALTPAPPPPDP